MQAAHCPKAQAKRRDWAGTLLFDVPRNYFSLRTRSACGGSRLVLVLTIVGITIGIPECVLSICSLSGVQLIAVNAWPLLRTMLMWAAIAGLGSIVLAGCVRARDTGFLYLISEKKARRELKPNTDAPASEVTEQHAALITEQPALLRMTPKEFAERVPLPPYQAWFLIRNPMFVPRSEVIVGIRAAFMVPEYWPSQGYGPECTRRRLLWFASKGLFVWTVERIQGTTEEGRSLALQILEEELRRGSTHHV